MRARSAMALPPLPPPPPLLQLLPPLLLLLPLASAQPRSCFQPIQPVHKTEPLNDPDDPAVWVSPDNPAESLIVGTDKGADGPDGRRVNSSIAAFTTSGSVVARLPLRRPNNVDVEYGLIVGGQSTDIAVTCERERQAIRVFALPSMQPIDGGGLPAFLGEAEQERLCMGVGLYKRPHDGAVFAILSRKSGPSGSYLWQYRLSDADGDGVVEAALVRQFGQFSGDGEIEAVAVDDAANRVYYSDEGCCVRAYAADPADDEGQLTADELAAFGHEGFARDREGISIYALGASSPRMDPEEAAALADDFQHGPLPGFLFVSDQQRTGTFRVFCREAPHAHVASIRLAGTDGSDGSEVTPFSLGPGFESGAFVAMSDTGHRFNLYSWASIASCLDERGATQICATSQTDIIDPEDSGGEPFAAKFIAVAVLLALAIASFQLVYKMIFEEKVLIDNSKRYRGEVVARISGSASKSRLDLLEEADEDTEAQPMLVPAGGDSGGGGKSRSTPDGYQRHATPTQQRAQTTADLHGLEPASRLGQNPGRPNAARSLSMGGHRGVGGTEAALLQARYEHEVREQFNEAADADSDSNGQLDRSKVAQLARRVLGTELDEESLKEALKEILLTSEDSEQSEQGHGPPPPLIGFEEFFAWVQGVRLRS